MQSSSMISEIQADTFAAGLEETHQTLHKNLRDAHPSQAKYVSSKEVVFEVGDRVSLSIQLF